MKYNLYKIKIKFFEDKKEYFVFFTDIREEWQ